MRWISVEEDIPPEGVECFIYGILKSSFSGVITKLVLRGKFSYKKGWDSEPINLAEVHYWASMPALPEIKVEQPIKEAEAE